MTEGFTAQCGIDVDMDADTDRDIYIYVDRQIFRIQGYRDMEIQRHGRRDRCG